MWARKETDKVECNTLALHDPELATGVQFSQATAVLVLIVQSPGLVYNGQPSFAGVSGMLPPTWLHIGCILYSPMKPWNSLKRLHGLWEVSSFNTAGPDCGQGRRFLCTLAWKVPGPRQREEEPCKFE